MSALTARVDRLERDGDDVAIDEHGAEFCPSCPPRCVRFIRDGETADDLPPCTACGRPARKLVISKVLYAPEK
jgi:hypothetical protein